MNQVPKAYTNEELLKMDPFIKYWENNYSVNIKNEVFSWERSRPLRFLMNVMPYQKIPIVLVAAGPSLDKNIHLLKEYQNNCLILCADIVLFKLIENGIKPDFVINIDPHPEISVGWKDLSDTWYDTSDMILACPTTANYETLCNWKGKILFFNQTDRMTGHKGPFLKKLTNPTSGFGSIENCFFIGATMFQFSSILSPSHVLLIGYDFAYTGNKSFCSGLMERRAIHQLKEQKVPVTDESIKAHTQDLNNLSIARRDLIARINEVDIPTTNTFKLYMDTFNGLLKTYKIKTINCTEGGILSSIPIVPFDIGLQSFCKDGIKKHDIFDSKILSNKRRRRH